MTFAVVNAVFPLGKPGGIAYVLGLKNGGAWSTPSSMIPILIPLPAVLKSDPHICGAPIRPGLRSRSGRYATFGQTFATPGVAARRPSSDRGTTTARPSRMTLYRQVTFDRRIVVVIRAASVPPAADSH